MNLRVQITCQPIPEKIPPPENIRGLLGAWVEFRGIVRAEEQGHPIAALEYEAYETMARKEMRSILDSLSKQFDVLAAVVVHRTGIIRVGETALYAGFAAGHRQAAFRMQDAFLNELKQRVPIWKKRALTAAELDQNIPA